MAFNEVLRLVLDVDAAKGKQGVDQFNSGLTRMGSQVSQVGGALTRNVTLPIVALGGLATKMASDFDSSFVRMQTLAGVTADEVGGLKDSVLALAGETGRAPNELAEALFFLSSSGLDSAAAMEALEASAKASAAGMGSTIDIANGVSSAMNAYATSGLSAAEATDVLIATARAGKAEPAELAAQMGRVLPIAAELGVTFQDVGAATAALSLAGNDAAASTTQLTNLLSKLLKPSEQSAKALDAVGLSVEDLRGMIAEKGLLGTLEELRARLGDNGFAKFLEDQQAVLAGLSLTGENVAKNREIFEDLSDSTGELDSAFGKWAESMGAKNARAFADLQVAMIEFGEAIAPVVSDILGFVGDIASVFADLPEPVQTALLAFLALAAATGPITQLVGGAMQLWGALGKVKAVASGLSFGSIAVGLGVLTPLVLGLTYAWQQDAKAKAEAKARTDDLTDALKREAEGVSAASEEVIASMLTAGDLGTKLRDAGADMTVFIDAVKSGGDELEELVKFARGGVLPEFIDDLAASGNALGQELERLAEAGDLSEDELVGLVLALDELSGNYADATEATANQEFAQESLGGEYGATTEEIEGQTEALKSQADQLQAMFDPFFGMIDALQSQQDAQAELRQRTAELDEAIRTYGEGSVEALEAQMALTDAQNTARESVVDLQAAAFALRDEMVNNGLSAEAATQQFVSMATQMGFTEAEALSMAAMLGIAATAADTLGATDPTVDVGILGSATALEAMAAVEQKALELDGKTITVSVNARTTFSGRVGGMPVFHAGGVVPGPRGQEIAAVLQAGEEVLEFGDPRHIANIASLSGAVSARMAGAGSTTVVNEFHFHGPVASQGDAERWVAQAWNRAYEQNLVNARGRRL